MGTSYYREKYLSWPMKYLLAKKYFWSRGQNKYFFGRRILAAPRGPKTGMRRGLPKAPRAELEVTRGGAPAMGLAGH